VNTIRALAVLAGTSMALVASPAWSQLAKGPLEYMTQKPLLIRAQVELGAQFADQAITVLQSSTEVEELQRARALVQKSYELLRFATAGIETINVVNAEPKGMPNPGLKIALEWISAARFRNISAGMAIDNSVGWESTREEYVSKALEELGPVPELARRASLLIR
jgi:hypothetical protein